MLAAPAEDMRFSAQRARRTMRTCSDAPTVCVYARRPLSTMLALYTPVCGFSSAPIVAPRVSPAAASVRMSVAEMYASALASP